MQYSTTVTMFLAALLLFSSEVRARAVANPMEMTMEQARALKPHELPPLIVGEATPPEYLLRAGYAIDHFHAKRQYNTVPIPHDGTFDPNPWIRTQSNCESSKASPIYEHAWVASFSLGAQIGSTTQNNTQGSQCTTLIVQDGATIAWCGCPGYEQTFKLLGGYATGICDTCKTGFDVGDQYWLTTGGFQVLNENTYCHVVVFSSEMAR